MIAQITDLQAVNVGILLNSSATPPSMLAQLCLFATILDCIHIHTAMM